MPYVITTIFLAVSQNGKNLPFCYVQLHPKKAGTIESTGKHRHLLSECLAKVENKSDKLDNPKEISLTMCLFLDSHSQSLRVD